MWARSTGSSPPSSRPTSQRCEWEQEAEALPELGPGTATYGESASAPSHDARGHATKRFDGQHRLLLGYDRAERLVTVHDGCLVRHSDRF